MGTRALPLALLDGRGDGFVISSLHARAVTRMYAKAIAGGGSEAALSTEESEALRQALAKPAPGAGRDRRCRGAGRPACQQSCHDPRHPPRMPPVPPAPDPMIRTQEPAARPAARADPGLARVRADRVDAAARGDRRVGRASGISTGIDAAARRAQRGAAPRGHARGWAAARGRGRRDRQDPGHHAPDRVADRDPAGEAVGDPRAHVHGQGRRGDAAPGGPARAVRLRGHRDLDVPRLRRPAHPGVRVRARAGAGRAGAVAPRGHRVPAGAAVRASDLEEYRPLGDPTRFLGALAQLFARCRDEDVSPAAYLAHADRLGGAGARALAAAGHGRRAGRGGSSMRPPRQPRTARRQAELARAYARYTTLLREHGAIDFGDQVALALQLLREFGRGARGAPGALPVHPGGRVPGHEPGASRSSSRCSRSGTGT